MCLTQIEIFRFIEFHFVSKGGGKVVVGRFPCVRYAQWPPTFRRSVTMARQFRMANRVRCLVLLVFCSSTSTGIACAQATGSPQPPAAYGCRVEAVNYKGWRAQQLSNRWVQLILLPQNGGRLIQT